MKTRILLLLTIALASGNAHAALLVRESFDGMTGFLDGATNNPSSLGFGASPWWGNPASQAATNAIWLASDASFAEVPVTNALPRQLGTGEANRGGVMSDGSYEEDSSGWLMRPLAPGARLNLGADGVYYLTFTLLYRDNDSLGFGFAATNGASYAFLSIGPNWNTTTFNTNASAKRLAVARGADINVWPGVSGARAYSTAQVSNNWFYLVLVKITARASGNDTLQAAFFNSARPGYGILPANESNVVWDLTDSFTDNRSYDQLLAFINGPLVTPPLFPLLDGFRMGTRYADVAQIEPLITSQPTPWPSDTVYAGMAVSMSVAATGGVPEPHFYQWWRNNSPIPNATNATFALSRAAVEDSGEYFVVVANRNGSVTSVTNPIMILPRTWGNALSFDGVDDYVAVPSGIWFSNEFTIEAWVYERSYQSWARVLDFGNGPVADNVVFCLSAENTGRPCFQVFTPTSSPRLDALDPLPTNQWVHLAVTFQTNWGTIYVNGAKTAEGEIATPRSIIRTNNYLGRSNWGDPSPDAVFDDVRIWGVARTPEEIREGMCHGLNGTESNLVAYYRLDDGSGSIARDATVNHLDATLGLNGTAWTNSTIPAFIDVTATIAPGLPGVFLGTVAWGDYDNDGRLDFLLTGATRSGYIAQVWRNTGSGFTNVTATLAPGLPGVVVSSVAWGDYDNDGRLDFLLTGHTDSDQIAQVWRNTGGGFTNAPIPELPGVENGSVAWGDYDNDGRLDFLLTGYAFAQVWRNTGSGFTNVTATIAPGLRSLQRSSVAWGDYDNDGRLDFLLTGNTFSGPIAQVWRNTGSGFTNLNAGLPGVSSGSVAWGDYDNDGRLDFLLTGASVLGYVAQVWRNTGSGFTNLNAGLPGVSSGSVAWGDYDNDGRLDILLTGQTFSGPIAQVWRNTGSGFTNLNAGPPGVSSGSVAWGDYDNDGRLDFLLTGHTDSDRIAQVWRNIGWTANTPPTPPTGLRVAAAGSAVTLIWNRANDAETAAAGLSYNLRVGTTPGGSDIVLPQASAAGVPRLPALGAAQQALRVPLTLPPRSGRIYWSVQAVDSAFAGSPFSAESSFTLWPMLGPDTGLVPGDANGDGVVNAADLDILLARLNGNGTVTSSDLAAVLARLHGSGTVTEGDLSLVLTNYWPTSPWLSMTNVVGLGGTNVTFALTNATAGAFSVLTSTNLADWEYLGPATPRYEFTDTNAPAIPERFYRLRWP